MHAVLFTTDTGSASFKHLRRALLVERSLSQAAVGLQLQCTVHTC